MSQSLFDALIFDHDGTLVDTERQDYQACRHLFEEHGQPLPLEYWAEHIVGRWGGYDVIFEELIQTVGAGLTKEDLWTRFRANWRSNLDQVSLMPAVEQVIPALHAAGHTLAVATASNRDWADRWLGQFALRSYFQVVATKDDVMQTKPAPDVYLFAAEQLAVDPARCLVFEDTQAGVQSAKAAGMTVVAVPSPLTQSLNFDQADYVIDGLGGVDSAWIMGLS